jgi:hypothetical protein
MSDFFIQVKPGATANPLLALARAPYSHRRPDGKGFVFPWGSVAVLEERFGKNIFVIKGTLVAWVGDLIADVSEPFLESLLAGVLELRSGNVETGPALRSHPAFARLNGCYAFVIADAQGFSVITDPMNYVQAYLATDDRGAITAVGTHPDLTAKIGGQVSALDLVSVGEFLNAGTPLFPNTVYRNVKELHPGSVFTVTLATQGQRLNRDVYWSPPDESRNGTSGAALAEELRDILLSIVRARCQGRTGVFLSGGLDSRLIMAAVPRDVECVGLTFSNHPNRETRTAQRVAACYGREWNLIVREPDYLANCLLDSIKLTGCEYDWICAQVIGVARDLAKLDVNVILEGTLFNDYFTAFCARDWRHHKHWGGFLPNRFEKAGWNYVDQITPVWRGHFSGDLLGLMRERRQHTWQAFADPRRGSAAEWMEIYPFTQDPTVGYWPAERRTLPVRLVAMDRRALDFSFRCPIEYKLGSRLYKKAACKIYGKGNRIPNANDGVRPNSSHWSRLGQRAVHEAKRRSARLVNQLRGRSQVPHSWHDYPRYWRENARMKQFCQQYGPNLDDFSGTLFAGNGRELLTGGTLSWDNGFRLLQLAVWRELVRGYTL